MSCLCNITLLEPIKETLSQTKIKKLVLNDNAFGNDGLKILSETIVESEVEDLQIAMCEITLFEPLIRILPQTKITLLNLKINQLGNNGFKDLCEVLSKSCIEFLFLKRCHITSLEPLENDFTRHKH